MTHIDKNYGPIILGDYIVHQENHIDKQLNVVNGESFASEQTWSRQEATDADNETCGGEKPEYCMDKRVRRIFEKAEADGLLSQVSDGYVWHENATFLDYFLGRALCGDYPSSGGSLDRPVWCYDERGKNMPVTDMNRLFGRKNIGTARRSRHMQAVPNGHERVDEIIDACG